MPMPGWAAQVSTRYASPLMRHVSGRLPWFATVEHVGRSSGRRYRSPLNVFLRDDRAVFALTYGPDAHWVRNVMAAGRCSIETQGRDIELVDPEIIIDRQRRLVPWLVRLPLAVIGVDRFLVMRRRRSMP